MMNDKIYVLLVSSNDHELHPILEDPESFRIDETLLARLWKPWSQWVLRMRTTTTTKDGNPHYVLIRSQCPCCDGVSNESMNYNVYWELLSGLWTAAARFPREGVEESITLNDLFVPTLLSLLHMGGNKRMTGVKQSSVVAAAGISPWFWDRVSEWTAKLHPWNGDPHELPGTLDPDVKSWREIMEQQRFISWDYHQLMDNRSSWVTTMHFYLPPVSPTVLCFYDVEWLVVKWVKGLGSYDDDISTVIPAYPSDELNRPLPPWLVRTVFHRYQTSSGPRVSSSAEFLRPLSMLVAEHDGYAILETVFEVLCLVRDWIFKEDKASLNKKIIGYLENRKQQLLCDGHEEAAVMVWDLNYSVQCFYEAGAVPKYCPTILLSAWLGRSMMWVSDPFLEAKSMDQIWDGLWTQQVFLMPSGSSEMLLGEYVLSPTDREKYKTLLKLLHQHPERCKNWSRIRVTNGQRTLMHRLRKVVTDRWTIFLQTIVRNPPGEPLGFEYMNTYQWIHPEILQRHAIAEENPDFVREACRCLYRDFFNLSKRNIFLLLNHTLLHQDSQTRCLEHLSFLCGGGSGIIIEAPSIL